MRWFWEVWNVCCDLSKNGVPIKAVTAWSLFGAHGWETLLTSPDGRYEPGVFDLRGGTPRATALVKLLQTLSTGEDFWHPVLAQKGWWHRNDRFLHPAMGHCYSNMPGDSSPILIVGDGELMHAFVNACNARSLCHHVVDNFDNGVDFTGLLQTEIETFKPWAVVDVSDQSEISALTEEICGLYNLATMHVAAETDNVYALANASLDLLIDDDKYMNLSQSALILS
jgi:dTDP-4-dehydrorhamnose reductase